MRKAQVTSFILIGLLLLSVVGFLYFVSSYKKKATFTQQKEEVDALFQKTGKYNAYVQGCLHEATKRGIILIGTQGGVIYNDQAPNTKQLLKEPEYRFGQYVLPFVFDDIFNFEQNELKRTYYVNYAIRKPDLSLGLTSHPKVPNYPFGNVPITSDPTTINPMYTNMFGNMVNNPLPPLCDTNGANNPSTSGALFTCETYDSPRETDKNSVQEYLETFIAHDVETCVNIEELTETEAVSVEKSEVNATVTFNPTGIDVALDFAITIQGEQETAPTIQLQKFHTSSPVRLKQIHELLTKVVRNETKDIFFDMQRDTGELNDCKEPGNPSPVLCLKEGMKVYKYQDVCLYEGGCTEDGKYDDIFVIEDEHSFIGGRPFLFFAAIENRIPVLEYIRQTEDPNYEIIVDVLDTIHIDPQAYDPDEDTHNLAGRMEGSYFYSGWKEDYDDANTVDACLDSSSGYTYEQCLANIADFTQYRAYDTPLYLWNASVEYQATGREASVTTVPQDVGAHTTRVIIMDNEGLYDYQDIHILVKPEEPAP